MFTQNQGNKSKVLAFMANINDQIQSAITCIQANLGSWHQVHGFILMSYNFFFEQIQGMRQNVNILHRIISDFFHS